MDLSQEERRKIYEEEKAKIEAESGQKDTKGEQTTGLPRNIAGLLCYIGAWITGIIFLVIEQKDRQVRFHAVQSIVVFGALSIASGLLSWIPVIGGFFGAVIGITAVVLWIVLMIRTYQGVLFKVPIAGDIAEAIFPIDGKGGGEKPLGEKESSETEKGKQEEKAAPEKSESKEEIGKRIEEYITKSRAARITGYSFTIFFNIAMLIFLSAFYKYVAWYSTGADGSVTRLPILTNDYHTWLPIFITVTSLTIATYIMLIIYDKLWFRESAQIFITVIGLVSVASLAAIFPFDFSVIPNETAVDAVPVAVNAVLIFVAVMMGVAILVRSAKLISLAVK